MSKALAEAEANAQMAAEAALELRDKHDAYVASTSDRIKEVERRAKESDSSNQHHMDALRASANASQGSEQASLPSFAFLFIYF